MSFAATALLRRGAAAARPLALSAPQRRWMSGDAAEAAVEMGKWTKYSYGAIAFCGCLTTYIGFIEYQHFAHPHHVEDIAYSHKKIRSKPYPWDCADCNLFEPKCFADCKAAMAEQ